MTTAVTPAPDMTWHDLLKNYHQLIQRVDGLCRQITGEFITDIACKEGCDACCRHITLFPVEAAVLALALNDLSPEQNCGIRERARNASPATPCPLLNAGRCQLYQFRPLICRTHGMPLLIGTGSDRRVDFCPLNFAGVTTLPGSAIIDLDRLNELLVAVNALFCATSPFFPSATRRYTIAEALRLRLPDRPLSGEQPF